MKPGNIVQVYRRFRVYGINMSQDMFLNPGDVCLLTDFKYIQEQHPNFSVMPYFKVKVYTGGRSWTATLNVANEQGIGDFMRIKK